MNFSDKYFENKYYWIFVALVVTLIAYLPALFNNFVNWDDDVYILNNYLIRSLSFDNFKLWFSSPFHGLYQPLVLLSLAIDYSINGLDPTVFHTHNVLLHILNTILVYFFVRKMFNNNIMAVLSMLLFGLHPLHVESVAWATERKDVLYSFFFLSGLITYLIYLEKKKPVFYLLTLLLFVLSLLSKAAAVAFPLILVIIDIYQKNGIPKLKHILNKTPFFILAFGFGLLTLYYHYKFGSLANYSDLTIYERVFLGSKGLMYFLSKAIWPMGLAPYNALPPNVNAELFAEGVFYILIYLLAGYILYRFRQKFPIVLFGAAFFLLTIGFFLVPPGVPVIASERYFYIPGIGLFIILSHILKRYLIDKEKGGSIALAITGIFLLFFGVRTFQQNLVWKNSTTLWTHAIEVRGESFYNLLQRGNAHRLSGDYEAALIDFNRAVFLKPDYYRTYDKRGHLFLLLGENQKAIDDFNKAVRLQPKNAFGHCSLGFAYRKEGDTQQAMKHLNRAIRLWPEYADAYFNLGLVWAELGENQKARTNLKHAIDLGLSKSNEAQALDMMRELTNTSISE